MNASKRVLLAAIMAGAGLATVAQAAEAPKTPAWVAESNANAQILLKVMADFAPEQAGQMGVDGLDAQATDLTPDLVERVNKAVDGAEAELKARQAKATQPEVKQDLQILIQASEDVKADNALQEQYMLQYNNVPQLIFFGVRALIDPRVPLERQQAVVERMKAYAGMVPGRKPITEQAKVLFENSLKTPGLIGPYTAEVQQDMQDDPHYIAGLKQLLSHSKVKGWEPVYAKLAQQMTDYVAWIKTDVVPHARKTNRLPEAMYANQLHQMGVDEDPRKLMREAMFSYAEIQHQMEGMAILVARQHGFKSTDYRDVIRELKKDQIVGKAILPLYKKRLAEIEKIIRAERIVSLPDRNVVIRMASAAETAAEPAPHMNPPRLIGNTGQYGEFVLPLNEGKKGNKAEQMDDDTFDAAAWTLTAHEARPGHELQFASMIEHGVSIARAVFAFNSANVEGWALYSEAEMQPYEPLDGQLIALDNRLLRAARAFLDPMVNLGLITPADVKTFLEQEVVLSPGFAKEESDRFSFRMPGQATSYYYGYHNLMEIRGDAQVKLGQKFDRMKFNDFILSQGLLPPNLLRKAVEEQFIPSQL